MEKRSVSCEKARNISIVKTLERLGHFPTRKSEKEAWFLSPLRSETQASFKVSLPLNRWYDHGMGKGGNVIDLVVMIKHFTVREALEFLSSSFLSFSFQQQPKSVESDFQDRIQIIKDTEIENPLLINYLHERKIPLKIARSFCRELHYKFKKRNFFAIGLKNHLGGWELRNKFFKNSSSPKSYSWFKNSQNKLLVLEGMFDFLSLATMDFDLVERSDWIILNSISFINDIQDICPFYTQVFLYLDNDPAGRKACHRLQVFSNNIVDMSREYSEYKDLNEKLKAER